MHKLYHNDPGLRQHTRLNGDTRYNLYDSWKVLVKKTASRCSYGKSCTQQHGTNYTAAQLNTWKERYHLKSLYSRDFEAISACS